MISWVLLESLRTRRACKQCPDRMMNLSSYSSSAIRRLWELGRNVSPAISNKRPTVPAKPILWRPNS